ncbi:MULTISPECIES: branched-chain amino acid ABC transporter permease [Maritimibacter]|jgi:branched-chain amino acid transport system permease protein|uniref:Branched-chain amino acid ABC transporter, permease protein n=1 Tax=Maritimibacter alkaliphilus HTCC2654 TaxID=314271 RepID=A3VG61_9RHOB|nr:MULTISPECIES: branched-chain amino acid ABC transporter permease [Maritimibacter]EAQ12837.1 branched-chain amino acid ABC transporter, permease protein [Rhodobacterales bacterium HTCC2654] [Maritimibacter alkaliphilus HTCC2654]TYP85770.1 amino acid/amide ABC transporter membrane protein 2 (HAAT family) [Maritimibacter alkaliphilus HTCC2654]
MTRLARIPFAAEALLVLVVIAAFFAFPYNLAFVTRILIMVLFVLSIDLVLGFAGIATLGQAAMYGTGAYAAGLFAVHVTAAPLPGLVVGMVAGAILAVVSGLVLMRTKGLTLIMLTIAVAQICHEIANKARDVTGGADGLRGIRMEPVLGLFEFDFIGRTAYWYVAVVVFVVFLALRRLAAAPLGLSLRGIHESPERMTAIGAPVYRRQVLAYTLGGGIAGIAGALAAQVTQLVSLEVYSFTLSAEALIMLILGGTGRLWGAIVGTVLFMTVHHVAASADPFNWLFLIGFLVLGVVFFLPGGMIRLPAALMRLGRRS